MRDFLDFFYRCTNIKQLLYKYLLKLFLVFCQKKSNNSGSRYLLEVGDCSSSQVPHVCSARKPLSLYNLSLPLLFLYLHRFVC